jgi:hypothetical protein
VRRPTHGVSSRGLHRLVNGAHNVSVMVITLTDCMTIQEPDDRLCNSDRNA